ncbi:MAG: excisionase [Candidatus Symbiopectobacterium sp. Dall1.0]|nr:excisionase [Candidatus Symbiopectobacterium sp. Dall1.0]
MAYITLSEWNRRQPRPRCMETIRIAARTGKFRPLAIFEGRAYLVDETATRLSRNDTFYPSNTTPPSLVSRIKYGTSKRT